VVVGGSEIAIRRLTGADQGHGGITVDGSNRVIVTDNVVRDAGAGIIVTRADTVRIGANRVSHSAFGGIVVILSPDDLALTSDANALIDDAALDNGGDGIRVGEAQTANLVGGNRAERNTRLGIDAAPGTIDGGGNRAARNGDPWQCVDVTCAP
jgi:parallel beta-helix repeat protein